MSVYELDAVSHLIGLAFADNPNTLNVAGSNRSRAQRMTERAVRIAKLNRKFNTVLVAHSEGRLIGALNAAPWPYCQLGAIETIAAAPAIAKAMGFALARQLRITGTWAKHDPKKPHWHIGPLGVLPEAQGRGVGMAMLAAFLEIADQQDLPAYLETDTDRNVAFYRRVGFKVVANEQIMGIDNRFMWRETSASGVKGK